MSRKSETLTIYLTPEMKEAMTIAAEADGRTLANYATWVIHRALTERLGSNPGAAARALADRRVPAGMAVPPPRNPPPDHIIQHQRVIHKWMPSVRDWQKTRHALGMTQEEQNAFVHPRMLEWKAGLRETLLDPPDLITPQGEE